MCIRDRGIVARDAEKHRRTIAAEFQRAAAGPHILVVVFEAGDVEIVAEAAARQARDRPADAEHVVDRHTGGDDQIGLIIAAIGAADAEFGRIGVERARHIFDRTADGVADVYKRQISAIVSSVLGLIIGSPTLRVSGDYLAIVTLAFGEIFPPPPPPLSSPPFPYLPTFPNFIPFIPYFYILSINLSYTHNCLLYTSRCV